MIAVDKAYFRAISDAALFYFQSGQDNLSDDPCADVEQFYAATLLPQIVNFMNCGDIIEALIEDVYCAAPMDTATIERLTPAYRQLSNYAEWADGIRLKYIRKQAEAGIPIRNHAFIPHEPFRRLAEELSDALKFLRKYFPGYQAPVSKWDTKEKPSAVKPKSV